MSYIFKNPDFLQWLHELTHLGYEQNIMVSTDHKDVLELFFLEKKNAQDALEAYRKFKRRWTALTNQN